MNFFFVNFFNSQKPLVLVVIFLAKIVEVATSTLRIILISKGNRNIGFLLAILEIVLWVVIAGNVITGLNEYPLKAVAYGLGFSVGVYLGSLLESKLAIGNILIQAIVPEENGELIAGILRENGFGVTTVIGHGKEKSRTILYVYAKRKNSSIAVDIIKEHESEAMIIAHESKALSGGFTGQIRNLFK